VDQTSRDFLFFAHNAPLLNVFKVAWICL